MLKVMVGFCLAASAFHLNAMTLSEAYEKALLHSAEVREKSALEAMGQAVVDQASSALSPTVSSNYQYGYEDNQSSVRTGSNHGMMDSFTLSLSQSVYDESIGYTVEQRVTEKQRYTLSKDKILQSLALEVSKSYFSVLSAIQKKVMLKTSLKFYKTRLDQTKRFVDKGLASQVDHLKSQAELDDIQSQVSLADSEIQLARANFESWVGVPWSNVEEGLSVLSLSHLPDKDKALEMWLDGASKNIDLRLTILEVKQAKVTQDMASVEKRPTVYFEAGYTESDEVSSLSRSKDQYARLLFQFDLYRGGYYGARSSEARWNLRAKEERKAVVEQGVHRAIRQTWSQWRATSEQFEVEQSRVASAKKYLEFMLMSAERGLEDMVELYDAQEGLIKAQSSQIDAYYDALYAYLDLQAQVGAISRGLMTEVSGEH